MWLGHEHIVVGGLVWFESWKNVFCIRFFIFIILKVLDFDAQLVIFGPSSDPWEGTK